MNPIRDIKDLNSSNNWNSFLTYSVHSSKEACYQGIQRTPVKFRYLCSKGVVVRFLIKITGYSRQQTSRLIKQYRETGKIERQQRAYQGFKRLYTT